MLKTSDIKSMAQILRDMKYPPVKEDTDKDEPGTQGDKEEYQRKRKEIAKKFGVESCSALKDEEKRKACYAALDAAHVSDDEEEDEDDDPVGKNEEVIPEGPMFMISILAGSADQGAPDYEPDEAVVSQGHIIEWVNDDAVSHTATSSVDFGETFDTGLLNGGESYKLDTNKLDLGTYEYMCIVHPWMVSTIIIEESVE